MSPVDAPGLLHEMDRSGIAKALVWHVAQRDYDALEGNNLLAGAIEPHDRLLGCWALLPNQTNELGDLGAWLEQAAGLRIRALRAWCTGKQQHRYLLRREVLGDLLDAMVDRRLPLLLSVGGDGTWPEIYRLMASTPELRLVLCDLPCWGSDRFFRPLIEQYPHVYIEISGYFLDGGIEAFAETYGPDRMLFGTGFPATYQGAMMLTLAHAEIGDDARRAIAAGNIERILGEVRL